jgi:hypothetical protein
MIDKILRMSGELWNWYILLAIEFSQWQERKYACTSKHSIYKSAWVSISFLKVKLQIGISYTPSK